MVVGPDDWRVPDFDDTDLDPLACDPDATHDELGRPSGFPDGRATRRLARIFFLPHPFAQRHLVDADTFAIPTIDRPESGMMADRLILVLLGEVSACDQRQPRPSVYKIGNGSVRRSPRFGRCR
jgi:hypothetical protein